MKKNIYISGKITGVKNFAEVFEKKEQELTQLGHKVFNPAKHPDMFSWQQFMELDLKALSFCDSIYMMDGWESSKGARLELEEAKKLGLEIIFEKPEQKKEIKENLPVEKKVPVKKELTYYEKAKETLEQMQDNLIAFNTITEKGENRFSIEFCRIIDSLSKTIESFNAMEKSFERKKAEVEKKETRKINKEPEYER